MESTPQNVQPTVPNVAPSPVQPVEPVEKESKTLTYVVVGILVLLIFGVGGYVVYDRYFAERESTALTDVTNEEVVTEENEEAKNEETDENEVEPDEQGEIVTCINEEEHFSITYPREIEFDENCDYQLLAYSDVEDIEVIDDISNFRKNWLFDVSRTETDLTAYEYAQEEIGVLAAGGGVAEEGVLPGSYQFVNDISHYTSISTYYPVDGHMYVLNLNARNPNVSPVGNIQQVYNSIVATFESLDE